jgi:hypothetical protein
MQILLPNPIINEIQGQKIEQNGINRAKFPPRPKKSARFFTPMNEKYLPNDSMMTTNEPETSFLTLNRSKSYAF